MVDAYLIRDAIVGNPTADEKRAAIAALGDLIRDLDEAHAALGRMAVAVRVLAAEVRDLAGEPT